MTYGFYSEKDVEIKYFKTRQLSEMVCVFAPHDRINWSIEFKIRRTKLVKITTWYWVCVVMMLVSAGELPYAAPDWKPLCG